ncbi:MAG: epimerase, partial [bacterium]
SFVDDDIDCLVKLGFKDDVVGEVINIGPDEESVTINELSAIIAQLLNFNLDPVYMPDRPQEVKIATCSADKARRLLGYKTKVDLRQGLKQMIDYIKKRGPRKFKYHLDMEIINDKTPRTWVDKMF